MKFNIQKYDCGCLFALAEPSFFMLNTFWCLFESSKDYTC